MIELTAGTQARAGLSEDTVTDYAAAMAQRHQFPPVLVYRDDAGRYYLADGFHRVAAAGRIGATVIDAVVRDGSKADALWAAMGENRTHGLRFTDTDKRHAIRLAIAAWPDRSQTLIADQLGVSLTYVTQVRAAMSEEVDLPDRVMGKDSKMYPATRPTPDIVAVRRAEKWAAVEAMIRDGKQSREIKTEARVRGSFVAEVRRALFAHEPRPDVPAEADKSRAAVAARVAQLRALAEQGFSTRQIAGTLKMSVTHVGRLSRRYDIPISADAMVGKTQRHDSNRIMAQIVADAENLTSGLDLVHYASLHPVHLTEWIATLVHARRALSALIRRLEQEKQRDGEAPAPEHEHPADVEGSAGPDQPHTDSAGARDAAGVPQGVGGRAGEGPRSE